MSEYVMYLIGLVTGLFLPSFYDFLKCTLNALREAVLLSLELIECPVRKEYSEYDKLWAVPKLFTYKFIETFILYFREH